MSHDNIFTTIYMIAFILGCAFVPEQKTWLMRSAYIAVWSIFCFGFASLAIYLINLAGGM